MKKEFVVNIQPNESRAALLEDGQLVELYIERQSGERVAGNIYKGKVENVLPGMQAAFVNIGLERNAFLYVEDALAHPTALDDDEVDTEELQQRRFRGRPSIGDVLKVGQEIVVQVTKEPIGTKGARVVTSCSIPGRFLVLMPSASYIGVSRRIEDVAEKERLKSIAARMKPASMGVIVRTVAEGRDERDLKRDMRYLLKVWNRIMEKAGRLSAPTLLYRDYDLVYRLVRDFFTDEIDRLYVDSPDDFAKAKDILRSLAPRLRNRISLYHEDPPIFEGFGIESEIEKALRRKVWLDCGGYIVIDETEALVSIDVNTGKYIGTTNLSDTVLRTNVEAAREIARQLRLRNMAGIIIVDFIDMESAEDQQQVLRVLEEEVRRDRVKTNIVGFTSLGLVEITRKKVRRDLDEVMQKRCPYCDGTGRLLNEDTVALAAERKLRAASKNTDAEAFMVRVHPTVASVLIGPGGAGLHRLEQELGKAIFVKGSTDSPPDTIDVLWGGREEIEHKALPVRQGQTLDVQVTEPHVTNPKDGIARIEGYVVDVEGAGDLVGRTLRVEITKVFRTYAKGRVVGSAGSAGSGGGLPVDRSQSG